MTTKKATKTEENKINNIPPVNWQRDKNGLLNHIQHSFKEDGYVDWKALIPQKFFAINENKTSKVEIDKCEDKELLILLDGFKYIADLRGYYESVSRTVNSSPEHCTVVHEITWKPNYETEGEKKVTSGIGDATHSNTKGFGKKFLGPIAENRAFLRCVKNALKINVLGYDELDHATVDGKQNPQDDESPTSPHKVLQQKIEAKGKTFEDLREKLKESGDENADNYQDWKDIPKNKAANIIKKIELGKSKKQSNQT